MRYLIEVGVSNSDESEYTVLGTCHSTQQVNTLLHIYQEMNNNAQLKITAIPDPNLPLDKPEQQYDVWECKCGNRFTLPASPNMRAADVLCKACNWKGVSNRVQPG